MVVVRAFLCFRCAFLRPHACVMYSMFIMRAHVNVGGQLLKKTCAKDDVDGGARTRLLIGGGGGGRGAHILSIMFRTHPSHKTKRSCKIAIYNSRVRQHSTLNDARWSSSGVCSSTRSSLKGMQSAHASAPLSRPICV